jgi:hypothetical protein
MASIKPYQPHLHVILTQWAVTSQSSQRSLRVYPIMPIYQYLMFTFHFFLIIRNQRLIINKRSIVLYSHFTFVPKVTVEYKFDCQVHVLLT